MKLVLDEYVIEELPLPVRLLHDPEQDGITMQVLIGGTWNCICTLREDGTLGLWDVGNRQMHSKGFQMSSRHGPIVTKIQ